MSADVIVEGEINPILVSKLEDCNKIIQVQAFFSSKGIYSKLFGLTK